MNSNLEVMTIFIYKNFQNFRIHLFWQS